MTKVEEGEKYEFAISIAPSHTLGFRLMIWI